MWLSFDSFILLDQHQDPTGLSHAGERGCPLCLTAEVRLRHVLTEAMGVLIHRIPEFQNGLSQKEP